MDKTFDAATAEARIGAMWEAEGCFAAGANARPGAQSFCIVIPPPNVTGSLHMGHALNNTLQDILIRWHRMRGHDTLWQPGTDHAGIATQMVVERALAAAQQPGRREMGREAFIERVWEQKAASEGVILGQLKRLGASCDWSRTRFTMDEGLSRAVLKVFVALYNEGLIYRAKRLVNWDPHFETAISDLEVENIEVDGHMWHFRYPLAGGETYDYVEKDAEGNVTLRETRDYISIATTRPETMLGDGAVAVHPADERYAPIVGKLCEIPVGPKEHRRLIPIITDEYPDPEFGSGAVKITGAHDFNDYAVARRGGIPCYRLMDTKARLRDDGAPYAEEAAKAQAIVGGARLSEAEIDAINLVPDEYRGLDRLEARRRVVADITAEGLAVTGPDGAPLVEAKKIVQPFGDRSKVVIEPMLTDQWFVDARTLAQPALEAVRGGQTRFVPENWDKTYFQWLDNIDPWCISRQLWWGHQIPVWYDHDGHAYCAETEEEAFLQVKARWLKSYPEADISVRITPESITNIESSGRVLASTAFVTDGEFVDVMVSRDPDVLDTWFSSALWPFSTLGWPDETPELARYYKTDVLVTGFDIIFFWVARMMMMGLHFKQEVPFHTVYVHALVRDEHGKKMSKTLGNVIDPLDLIDEYGADAVRMTLASMAAMGRDIKLAVSRVAGYRNFGTKLWNAARFAEMNGCRPDPAFDPAGAAEPVNRWIVGDTARIAAATDAALAEFRFNDAANGLYAHVWGVFCDWYVEFAKPLLAEDHPARAETQGTMAWALDRCLILLHPVMPFITEDLWEQIGQGAGGRARRLVHTDWPELPLSLADASADREIGWTIRAIEAIRSLRAEMSLPAGARLALVVTGAGPEVAGRLERQGPLIERLARLSGIALADAAPEGSVTAALEDCALVLPLAGVIDIAAERARLDKAAEKLAREIAQIEGKLANERFMAKAPQAEIAKSRERLETAGAEAAGIAVALERLAQIG